MATKAETLKLRSLRSKPYRPIAARIVKATSEWFRRGQLGASSATELGRHTGARV